MIMMRLQVTTTLYQTYINIYNIHIGSVYIQHICMGRQFNKVLAHWYYLGIIYVL